MYKTRTVTPSREKYQLALVRIIALDPHSDSAKSLSKGFLDKHTK